MHKGSPSKKSSEVDPAVKRWSRATTANNAHCTQKGVAPLHENPAEPPLLLLCNGIGMATDGAQCMHKGSHLFTPVRVAPAVK